MPTIEVSVTHGIRCLDELAQAYDIRQLQRVSSLISHYGQSPRLNEQSAVIIAAPPASHVLYGAAGVELRGTDRTQGKGSVLPLVHLYGPEIATKLLSEEEAAAIAVQILNKSVRAIKQYLPEDAEHVLMRARVPYAALPQDVRQGARSLSAAKAIDFFCKRNGFEFRGKSPEFVELERIVRVPLSHTQYSSDDRAA